MYTNEVNCQIVIALLKAHGIRKVIASPGTTNIAFVGSIQNDPWFEVYSAVDERHGAYMAVGMAAETNEPIVLSCTGATASRNYIPALTEAYYRKLPILAITSTQIYVRRGQLFDQNIDRSQIQKDIAKLSVNCPMVHVGYERDYCERVVNEAILELNRDGGGPVHINLETQYSRDFTIRHLPDVRVIKRIGVADEVWPDIEPDSRVIVYIGSHRKFSKREEIALKTFLECHQAVAFVSMVSSYFGYGSISNQLTCMQGLDTYPEYEQLKPDLIIHIGEISADYGCGFVHDVAPVWRVSDDGQVRNRFARLEKVFEMPIAVFFEHYNSYDGESVRNEYLAVWNNVDARVRMNFPELPFCNTWIAKMLYENLPKGSVFHAGILSSLRSFDYLPPLKDVEGYCNVGGFGIDGCVSSLIGGALAFPSKLHFGMVGDLAFFYDLNAIGNRQIRNNVRIIVVNNGEGVEFSLYGNPGGLFGEQTADYIAAGRHFGNKSHELLKHYATDLGFKYLIAESQEEFNKAIGEFVSCESDMPILFECFVEKNAEIESVDCITHIERYAPQSNLRARLGKHVPSGFKAVIKKVIK